MSATISTGYMTFAARHANTTGDNVTTGWNYNGSYVGSIHRRRRHNQRHGAYYASYRRNEMRLGSQQVTDCVSTQRCHVIDVPSQFARGVGIKSSGASYESYGVGATKKHF
jgi:hypothetical protein